MNRNFEFCTPPLPDFLKNFQTEILCNFPIYKAEKRMHGGDFEKKQNDKNIGIDNQRFNFCEKCRIFGKNYHNAER